MEHPKDSGYREDERFNLKEHELLIEMAKTAMPKVTIVDCSRCAHVTFHALPQEDNYYMSATS
ncbi:hypothetical protein [Desulfovibrio subterraneus]|nr:hypothetical protein [Desulfovibrio subterraneus]